MQKSDALRAYEIYKLYTKETDGIIGLYDMCRGFANNIPDVDKPPAGVRAISSLLVRRSSSQALRLRRSSTRRWRIISTSSRAAARPRRLARRRSRKPRCVSTTRAGGVTTAQRWSLCIVAGGEGGRQGGGRQDPDAAGGDQLVRRRRESLRACALTRCAERIAKRPTQWDAKPAASSATSSAAAAPAPAAAASLDPFASLFGAPTPAAAPATSATPAGAVFDPFAAPPASATPSALSVDDKLMRILAVNQMASQPTPIAAAPLQPMAPGAGVAATPVFNPFPQQPLTAAAPATQQAPLSQGSFNIFGAPAAAPAQQPPQANWANPFM